LIQVVNLGDEDRQSFVGRAFFDGKNLAHGETLKGVSPYAVNGVGGKGNDFSLTQKVTGHSKGLA
jgi:hypothetical protein